MKKGYTIDKMKSFIQGALFIAGFYFTFLFAESYITYGQLGFKHLNIDWFTVLIPVALSVFDKKKISRPSQTESIFRFLKISLMIFGFSLAGLMFYNTTKGDAFYYMNRTVNASLIMACSYFIYKMLIYTYQEFFRYRKM
jgi:hypothetical protein